MIANWVKSQKALIDLERECEIAQLSTKISSLGAKECQNEGLSILNLEVEGTKTAMFGRCCVILQKIGGKQIESSFKVGDEVVLFNPKLRTSSATDANGSSLDNGSVFGLVAKVSNFIIEIVVEEFDDNQFDAPLRMDLRSNQKTHIKMMEALSTLENSDHPLVQMLFSPKDESLGYRVVVQDNIKLEKIYNPNLNESQHNAIKCSLGAPFISLIHGPPGTGKTSTLTELILQAVQRDMKILVCAPSNIAVDTILARLADYSSVLNSNAGGKKSSSSDSYTRKLNMVRIGHPARISANILQYSLDSLIENDEGTEIVQDVRKEIDAIRKSLDRSDRAGKSKKGGGASKGGGMDYATRREKRTELRALSKEARQRERTVVERILSRCNIVLSTCIGASSRLLDGLEEPFDLVVIDEAAQGLEAACWVPLLRGRGRAVLAGDHCQLPPTIKSDAAEKGGLSVTLFERIMRDPRFEGVAKLLNIQYRMNDLISSWASKEMYDGKILSDPSVAHHTLSDIVPPIVSPEDGSEQPVFPVMLLIDTSGCDMNEDSVTENGSHRNVHEANIVHKHILELIKAGLKPNQIGVITPYNGQLELLRSLLLPAEQPQPSVGSSSPADFSFVSLEGIDIKTIDGFQGGEKECIIMSLVRSDDSRTVGFLRDNRRINVGVTRAKRHLAVVCDTGTCSADPFLKTLLDHMMEKGEQLSAYEYLDTASAAGGDAGGSDEVSAKFSHLMLQVSSTGKPMTSEGGLPVPPAKKKKNTLIYSTGKQQPAGGVKSGGESSTAAAAVEIDFESLFKKLVKGEVSYGRVSVSGSNELTVTPFAAAAKSVAKKPLNTAALVFPPSLSAFQRMKCHEAADTLSLFHRSVGEGAERHIEVSKTSFDAAVTPENASAIAEKTVSKPVAPTAHAKSVVGNAFSAMEEDSDNEISGEKGMETVVVAAQTPPVPPVDKGMAEIRALLAQDRNARNVRVTEVTQQKESAKVEGERLTAAKKEKQDSKKKSGSKGKGATTAPADEDDDEAFLNAAIAENQKIAHYNQYRISGTPMPNPDRESNKKKLQDKLREAQNARKPTAPEEEKKAGSSSSSSSSGGNSRARPQPKKPVPNFGGGRLGSS